MHLTADAELDGRRERARDVGDAVLEIIRRERIDRRPIPALRLLLPERSSPGVLPMAERRSSITQAQYTCSVSIEGAEPGDMLEIQILDIETRVPWGINNTSATGGVFSPEHPGVRSDDALLDIPAGTRHVIRTGKVDGREVAFFADNIQVPLAPFLGILAVAPDPVVGEPRVTLPGVQSSRPPGAFGGNLDVKDLNAGTKVFLPIFHPGALFYTGDPHGAQGDGEVSGTAIEQSIALRRFPLRRP